MLETPSIVRNRVRVTRCIPLLALILAVPALAQPAASALALSPEQEALAKSITFDVATFRLNKDGTPRPSFSMPPNGDGFIMKNRPMRDIIRIAYTLNSGATLHFRGQPSWIDTDRWDIQAKVAAADIPTWQKLDPAGKQLALHQFLADWLKLSIAYDTQDYPVYALELNKGKPKLTEAKPGDTVTAPGGQAVPPGTWLWTTPTQMTAHTITMAQLAQMLSGHADRTVLDKTGLTGFYNFVLNFDTSDAASSMPGAPQNYTPPLGALPPAAVTPIESSAIKDQLGLKLAPTKAPIEGVVITHIERPPEN